MKRPMKRYAIVIERTSTGYSAYAPDVPGCGVAGDTLENTRRFLVEALQFHFEALRADGDPIPQPTAQVDAIELDPVTEPAPGR